MRFQPFVLIAAGLVVCLSATEPELLRQNPDDLRVVNRVLMDLSQGNTEALDALPDRLLLHPPGRQDTPGLTHRWTRDLARVLARSPQREAVVAALDQRFVRLLNLAPPHLDPRRTIAWSAALAVDFLPAPTAVHHLHAAADRAFDAGDKVRFRALVELLRQTGLPATSFTQRLQVTDDLVEANWSGTVPPGLGQRGPLRVVEAQVPTPRPEALRLLGGQLIRLDPWDRVLWQTILLPRASVWTAPDGALVMDHLGYHLYRPDGNRQDLGTISGLTCLGIVGGSVWFHVDGEIHRLVIDSGYRERLDLGHAPLCPPLVVAAETLWVTATTVQVHGPDKDPTIYHHGLDLGVGPWRLHGDDDEILLAGPGQTWRIDRLGAQAAAEEIVRAGGGRMLEDRLKNVPVPTVAQRHGLALARLARGPAGDHLDQAWQGITEREDRLRLAHRWRDDLSGHLAEALVLAEALPDLWLPHAAGDHPLDHPSHWRHVITAQVWTEALVSASATPTVTCPTVIIAGPLPLVQDTRHTTYPGISPILVHRQHPILGPVQDDGVWCYRLTREAPGTGLACHRVADGILRWQHRWMVPDTLPSRGLMRRDGRLLVSEGLSRIHLVDPLDGRHCGRFILPGDMALPHRLRVLSDERLAWLDPLDKQVLILDQHGRFLADCRVASGFRWVVPLAPGSGRALVCQGDGTIRILPDDVTVILPTMPRVEPLPTATGLWLDDVFYRWIAPGDPVRQGE